MALEFTREEKECLVDFLLKEVSLEGLYTLRNLLTAIKTAVEAYINSFIISEVDKAIESLSIGNLLPQKSAQVIDDINRKVLDIKNVLIGSALTKCPIVDSLFGKIDAITDMAFGGVSWMTSFNNRYKIISKLETARDDFIKSSLEVFDVFIDIINEVIAEFGG